MIGKGQSDNFYEGKYISLKEYEQLIIDIYMSIHISQLREFPPAISTAWWLGQSIYLERKR